MMSGVLLFVVCLSACCLSVTISIRRLSIAVSSWVVSITIHRLSALSGGRPWDPLCGRGPSSFFRPLFGPHPPSLLGHHSFGQSPLPLGHCSTNCHFSTTTQPLPATVRLIIAAIQPLFGPATILQSPSFAIGHRCLVVVLASALCHLPLFGSRWFRGWLCRWSPKLLSSSLFILHELHLF